MFKLTVIKLSWWLFGILALGMVLFPLVAQAEPTYKAILPGDITVTLYSDACKLTDTVSNLPLRATWTEKDKTFEGCFAFVQPMRILLFYFREDKTIAPLPVNFFFRITNT